jgi:hypothetical protein
MGAGAMQLPRIDFSSVDLSAPGAGAWSEVRAQVLDALATFGCFDAHYPALTPELRTALFEGAVRPLFALPVEAKRRNYYGADKPFHGYLGDISGYDGYESLAIVDGPKSEQVRAFADLMWPDGRHRGGFWYAVHLVSISFQPTPLVLVCIKYKRSNEAYCFAAHAVRPSMPRRSASSSSRWR